MSKKKNNKSALRSILIVLCIVLGLVLAALIVGTVYAEYLLGKVNYTDPDATVETLSQEDLDALYNETEPHDPDFVGPEYSEDEVFQETAPPMEEQSDNVITILLLGMDRRGNETCRSDSIILCTFNKTQNTITLTSLLRDMYVKIPGYKSNRINVPFALGGVPLLNETLRHNFGIETDGAVEIDFAHFKELIDLLGGIEIELSYAEANYVNQESGSRLDAGVQLLNGEQALCYSRFRGTATGDLARTNRQRIVLTTLLNEYKSKSLPELLGLMDDILPMVTTNLSKDEILTYVKDFFPMLATAEIVSQRIPVEGTYKQAKINGMAVVVFDVPDNADALQKTLSEYPEGVG
jgi:LCP family protein required for cell wall assembly